MRFRTPLTDTAGIIKTGGGTLKLDDTSLTYAGLTDVQAGTLQLGANGEAEAVNIPGDLEIDAGATLEIDIDAANANDVLNVTGTVTLGGALTLNVDANNTIATGTEIVLINNDGTDAVSGLFSNYTDGQTFTINGHTFQISYSGGAAGGAGDTNDVVLTALNDAPIISVDGPGGDSAVAALNETNAGLTVSDTLTLTDTDLTDTVNVAVTSVAVAGNDGHLTNAQLLAMMSIVEANPILNATETTDQFTWNFDSGSEAFDHLAVGESLTLTYTLTAADAPTGATDTQTVTITINGTNDAPTAVPRYRRCDRKRKPNLHPGDRQRPGCRSL